MFAQLDEAPGCTTSAARGLAAEPLIELYAHCDGARLFHDGIELAGARAVTTDDAGRARFGALEDEPVALDARGRVWRADASLEDDVCEGTRLDRWLAGIVDAVALLYDGDGEFADDIFDDAGELLPAVAERQLRAQLKRDPRAPAPRWRLAHALLAQDSFDAGRRELEEVVQHEPAFAWAWLDLARLSERSGEHAGALDEARAAAEAATAAKHAQAGYFWAQVARLAALAGDDVARADAARRAAAAAPGMKADQLAGAKESLAAGDVDSARGLLALLRAVWPRDLEVLALDRELAKNRE